MNMQLEPVRKWIYGLLVPVTALVVGYGLLTDTMAALWGAVIVAILVVPGTEVARTQVTPNGKVVLAVDPDAINPGPAGVTTVAGERSPLPTGTWVDSTNVQQALPD
jgi:hypothetical protein